jgi:hypothetical protein
MHPGECWCRPTCMRACLANQATTQHDRWMHDAAAFAPSHRKLQSPQRRSCTEPIACVVRGVFGGLRDRPSPPPGSPGWSMERCAVGVWRDKGSSEIRCRAVGRSAWQIVYPSDEVSRATTGIGNVGCKKHNARSIQSVQCISEVRRTQASPVFDPCDKPSETSRIINTPSRGKIK